MKHGCRSITRQVHGTYGTIYVGACGLGPRTSIKFFERYLGFHRTIRRRSLCMRERDMDWEPSTSGGNRKPTLINKNIFKATH